MDSKKVYKFIGSISPFYTLLTSIVGYRKSVDFFVSKLSFQKDDDIKVLDAGCGIGLYSSIILKKYRNSSVTAFDLNPKLVEELKKREFKNYPDRLKIFKADIQNPPKEIENEKFDLIITSGVLEYVPLQDTIKNLSKFLKLDGYFFNSPVKDNLYGKIVCNLYSCKPYSKKENLESFTRNNFSLDKHIYLPWYYPASFKEGYIFKKI